MKPKHLLCGWIVALLALPTPAAQLVSTNALSSQPRVVGMYSSWPKGTYTARTNHVGLLASLGWPFVNVENTNLTALVRELDRFDIFCPSTLYNYEHAQSFSTNIAEWKQFLERGGVIIGLDANYGQQVSWLTKLGDGLALGPGRCEIGCAEGTKKRVTLAVTNEPFAPRTATTLPWGHFNSHGPRWQVLARCPDGYAVCLKAEVGRGVVIATTLYPECGYPDATYLQRIWRAQVDKLMDSRVTVKLDPALKWVGENHLRLTVNNANAAAVHARSGVWHPGGSWQAQDIPLNQSGEADLLVSVIAGRTDLRLNVSAGERPVWWTSLTCENADLQAQAGAVQSVLRESAANLEKLAPTNELRRQQRDALGGLSRVGTETRALLQATASEQNQARWDALAVQLAAFNEQARVLSGRATVGARRLAEGASDVEPPLRCRSLGAVAETSSRRGPTRFLPRPAHAVGRAWRR